MAVPRAVKVAYGIASIASAFKVGEYFTNYLCDHCGSAIEGYLGGLNPRTVIYAGTVLATVAQGAVIMFSGHDKK